MSLRILHVLDHSVPLHSGYAFRTLAILREQRRRGWETVQLTSPKHYGASADEETCDGFRFYRTRVPSSAMRTAPVVGQWTVVTDTAARLAEIMDRTQPHVVHAHSPCLNGIAALKAARPRGVPVVYEMRASWEDAAVDHGTTTDGSLRYRLSRALETWTLRRADAVTTICEGLREDILSRGIPQPKVTVIPNAVNVEAFPVIERADAGLQRQLGLEGAFTLGFLGSFYGYEGLDTLIAAMPGILRVEPRARLLLVGGGFEEERLQAQATRLGLDGAVHFAGRVPHSEVARWYSLVDLLVFPRKSIRLTETVTPLKPLEAMAQSRLLIASNVGGHRELVRDGQTGFLFAPDDPSALEAAVHRVLECREQWSAIREAGRRFVEQERTWVDSVARYERVYAGLSGSRHAA
jgi:PEP-CTERM/exosortase A-associated glycosyltransferase